MQHVPSFAARYSSQLAKKRALKLISTAVFLELMQHPTWFKYEIGGLDSCLETLAVAKKACPDRDCFRYGQYCNISACAGYEQYNFLKCRENNVQCVAIFEKLLALDDLHLAISHGNMELLLFSEESYDEALRIFSLSEKSRTKHGNDSAYHLGQNIIMIGRVFLITGDFDTSANHYG